MTDQSGKTELPQPDTDDIVEVPVDQLLPDSENARLSWRTGASSQLDLIKGQTDGCSAHEEMRQTGIAIM